jgi:hypothetical protein
MTSESEDLLVHAHQVRRYEVGGDGRANDRMGEETSLFAV